MTVKFFSCLSFTKATGMQKGNFCLFLNTLPLNYIAHLCFLSWTNSDVFYENRCMGHSVYDVIAMHSHVCVPTDVNNWSLVTEQYMISERRDQTKSFIKSNFWRVSKNFITFRLKLSSSGTASTTLGYHVLETTSQIYYSSGNSIK